MVFIADTSPINYLVWIELADILPKFFVKIVIPPEVHAELLASDAPPAVQAPEPAPRLPASLAFRSQAHSAFWMRRPVKS
jgi:hypothetical protein